MLFYKNVIKAQKIPFCRQRELAIQSAVHQLSQSERWNTLSPIEQQQVIIKLNGYIFHQLYKTYFVCMSS